MDLVNDQTKLIFEHMPDSSAKISIIMPVKNTSAFLIECLDSIINQTFHDWELIAVDDHSDDDSFQILNDYAIRDNRIQTIKNKGKGIIEALRTAYAKCSGVYLTRMDSDDRMHKDKLSVMYSQLRDFGDGHVAVGLVEYFSADPLGEGYKRYAVWLNNMTTKSRNYEEIYKECSIPSPCWMVSLLDFEKCGALNSNVYPEDYDLVFRMRKAQLKIVGIPEVLHYWRDYPTRTSRTDPNYADNRFARLKITHFLDQDYSDQLELVVWGGSAKGKQLARLLNEHQVKFRWICNNPKKIGQDIYGVTMESDEVLSSIGGAQVIMAFLDHGVQDLTVEICDQNPNINLYRFC